MPVHYIITVGTSLITNRDVGWRWGQPLPEEADLRQHLRTADPVRASAETNTLSHLALEPGSSATWLRSQTPEGELCAAVLCGHYAASSDARLPGDIRVIESLDYKSSVAEAGLRSLVRIAFEVIREQARSRTPVEFCVTGGFKAEMACLNLVAILARCRAHYIHEQYRRLLTMPPLPVTWDTSLTRDHAGFFEWIEQEPRPEAEVRNRAKALPADIQPLVEFPGDGHGYLSATGLALYEAGKMQSGVPQIAVWPPDSGVAPGNKYQVSGEPHHRCGPFDRLVRSLEDIPCVSAIRYGHGGPPSLGPRASVENAQSGTLEVTVADGKQSDSVLVETTAHGDEQTELVRAELERIAKKVCK